MGVSSSFRREQQVNLQMRDYASHPCMRIDERHVDAEWLLENKECTDREFEHDQ